MELSQTCRKRRSGVHFYQQKGITNEEHKTLPNSGTADLHKAAPLFFSSLHISDTRRSLMNLGRNQKEVSASLAQPHLKKSFIHPLSMVRLVLCAIKGNLIHLLAYFVVFGNFPLFKGRRKMMGAQNNWCYFIGAVLLNVI